MEPRSRAVDVLRGLAILLVLGRHMDPVPNSASSIVKVVLDTCRRGGWIGVDLFFVLSGFLISGLLFREYEREGRIAFRRFFVRRGLRIYPPYYTLLFTVVVFQTLRPEWVASVFFQTVSVRSLLAESLFFQNYSDYIVGYTWSLAVEEHFYLILPLILLLLSRLPSRDPFEYLWIVLPLLSLIILDLRVFNASEHAFSFQTHFFPTHLRIDSLMYGVLLAHYAQYRSERFAAVFGRQRVAVALLGSLVLVPAFVLDVNTNAWITTIGVSCFAFGSALLIGAFVAGRFPENCVTRVVAWVGSCSYSIYLWHGFGKILPERISAITGTTLSHVTSTVIYLAGSIVLGSVAALLIEWPALRIREAMCPSRRPLATNSDAIEEGDIKWVPDEKRINAVLHS